MSDVVEHVMENAEELAEHVMENAEEYPVLAEVL